MSNKRRERAFRKARRRAIRESLRKSAKTLGMPLDEVRRIYRDTVISRTNRAVKGDDSRETTDLSRL